MHYRVIVYGPCDRAGWTLCGCYPELELAQIVALEYRREHRLAAVVRVAEEVAGHPQLTILEANLPRPQRLAQAPEFRKVALAL